MLEETLAAVRDELARLSDRVGKLEAQMTESAAALKAVSATGVDDELLAVISATIAAYLGCKPHIRQIRLLGNTNWVQNGRVTIQASHNFQTHHG